MKQINRTLVSGVALIAMVVSVFIAIGSQGTTVEAQIASTKGVSKSCEKYKKFYFQGILTPTLGSESKAKKVITDCQKKYPTFWDATPTISECKTLKSKLSSLGTKPFSKYLTSKKISASNAIFCGNYTFLWYENSVSANECWAYRTFYKDGSLTPFLYNDSKKAGTVITACKKIEGWELEDFETDEDEVEEIEFNF